MTLRRGILAVGALALLLLAYPTWAQFGLDEPAGWSIGVRGGAMISASEFEDGVGPTVWGYVRHGLLENWELEASGGYGRYKGADYGTDLGLLEGRLLFSPFDYNKWNPYLYAGLGAVRYDLDKIYIRTDDVEPIGWGLTIPGGAGVQYKLSDRMALEVSGGYTYTMLDDLNGAILKKHNDVYWTALVGLALGDFTGRPAAPRPRPTPMPTPVPRPEAPADRDGDGLTDAQETTVYFTNPMMADSDSDGLSDGDEVKLYRTNPNKADTDGGGVADGAEFDRGTNPLDAADDVTEAAPAPMPEAELVPAGIALPAVYFPTGGSVLTAEAEQQLRAAAQALKADKGILVEVRGHTDNAGTPADNVRLSVARARVVKAYLVAQGVARWRLTIIGVGRTQPIASNDTAEGRAKNRRVELVPLR